MEPQTQYPGPFTGLQIVQPKPGDMMFGGETNVLETPRNTGGDWRPDVAEEKTQLIVTPNGTILGDTEACTNFSSTNDIAAQLEWLIKNGQVDVNGTNFLQDNGYIGADGKVNLSPRYGAVTSGTTPKNGNNLPAVWTAIAEYGVVPESACPMPTFEDTDTIQSAWTKYYAPVEPEVTALGKKFLAWFGVQWEWVAWEGAEKTMAQLAAVMPVAPLQIATAVCSGWNTEDPILGCGDGTQHATTLLNVENGTAYDILDHYKPYLKQFAPNYSISYAVRGVVSSLAQNPPAAPSFTYDYMVNLVAGAPASALVTALQQGLQTVLDKTGTPYMKPGVFGPFGPQTMAALGRFQVDNGIADAPQGHDFGPKSRAALTAALTQLAFEASGEPIPRPLNPGSDRPN